MYCVKCNNELSKCTRPDMEERLKLISQASHFFIAPDYLERLQERAKHNKTKGEQERSLPE